MIKGVIFDLDNTIYNYDMCHEYAMKKLGGYACQKYKLNLEQFAKAFAEAKHYVKKRLAIQEHPITECFICKGF